MDEVAELRATIALMNKVWARQLAGSIWLRMYGCEGQPEDHLPEAERMIDAALEYAIYGDDGRLPDRRTEG